MPDKIGIGTFINDELELASNGIDLFTPPNIDNSQIHGKTLSYWPTNAITDTGPIEFYISNDNNDFTYLPMTRLEGEVEVVKSSTGATIDDTDVNALVNLFPAALFKQIELELNNVQISDLSTPTYHFKVNFIGLGSDL